MPIRMLSQYDLMKNFNRNAYEIAERADTTEYMALKPYSSARDEYNGAEASVFLDANENPYNTPNNRYPDPMQRELKNMIAPIKKVDPDTIFLGNGSDEAIDLVYRAFCIPGVIM